MSNCLDNKPEPTSFSTELNGLSHLIPIPEGATLVSNLAAIGENLFAPQYQNNNTLPTYETFHLQAIHDLITQPTAIGFRVYLGMDAFQKVRIVMVGVDPDGMDIIQRYQNNPSGDYPGEDYSIIVDESGQRWP